MFYYILYCLKVLIMLYSLIGNCGILAVIAGTLALYLKRSKHHK